MAQIDAAFQHGDCFSTCNYQHSLHNITYKSRGRHFGTRQLWPRSLEKRLITHPTVLVTGDRTSEHDEAAFGRLPWADPGWGATGPCPPKVLVLTLRLCRCMERFKNLFDVPPPPNTGLDPSLPTPANTERHPTIHYQTSNHTSCGLSRLMAVTPIPTFAKPLRNVKALCTDTCVIIDMIS